MSGMSFKKVMGAAVLGTILGAAAMYSQKDTLDKEVLRFQLRDVTPSQGFVSKERGLNLEIIARADDAHVSFYLRDRDTLYEIKEDNDEVVVGDVYHAWDHASRNEQIQLIYGTWKSLSPAEQESTLKQIGYDRFWAAAAPEVKREITRSLLRSSLHDKVDDMRFLWREYMGGFNQ